MIKNIDYIGNHILLYNINKLKTHLTFKERRAIEDNLIQNLTLDEINALEYWSLIYSKSQSLSYSAARILDVFYSKNWNKLISNKKHYQQSKNGSTWVRIINNNKCYKNMNLLN